VTAWPVLRAASSGWTRRLVQTAVILVVLTASGAAALLGLTLLTSANEYFYSGFADQHGAELAVTVDAARVTPAQLAATRRLAGVTQAAGPYPEVTVTLATSGSAAGEQGRPTGSGRGSGKPHGRGAAGPPSAGGGMSVPGLTVVGRASRGGPMDDLTLNGGHFVTGPGQISLAIYQPIRVAPGSTVTVTSAPGRPKLTVVGFAGSAVRDEDAWVTPAQVAALRPKGAAPQEQMLYNFTQAGTVTQIHHDIAALKAALPAGAVVGTVSWLASSDQTGAEQSVNTAFVVAFAVIGLALAVLIVANVASGAVVAAYRRIGVLKSIGFTPAQVTAVYVTQIGVPALAGSLVGVALGNKWVIPTLNNGGGVFEAGRQYVPAWINVAVPLGMCALVAVAALLPALRAGRLSAVQAISAGQAPRQGRGYAAHRLAGVLALPRPVTIGLAAPFSRPARSAVTFAAITFGLIAVVLAVGIDSSLAKINAGATKGQGQVQIGPGGGAPGQGLTARQDRVISAALRAQPGTLHYVAESDLGFPGAEPVVRVPALGHVLVPVIAYQGDSAGLGWILLSGTWFHGPGQVVVTSGFLAQAHLSVGDSVTITVNGKAIRALITGQVSGGIQGPALATSRQTLGSAAAGLAVFEYDVTLRPGTSVRAYLSAVTRSLGPDYFVGTPGRGAPGYQLIDTSYIRLLTLMMAILAGLGVLNSVLMVTRERVHDLGVFKAIGMTPRQTVTMVTCWVVVPAIAAAVIGLPAGMILHNGVMQALARDINQGLPGTSELPGVFLDVYAAGELTLLALAGLVIAAAGALLPATWAALTRTTTALRAE